MLMEEFLQLLENQQMKINIQTMKIFKTVYCLLMAVLFTACSSSKQYKTIVVKNTLNHERSNEVVELDNSSLGLKKIDASVGVKNVATNEFMLTQLVDQDGDGTMDQLLFQPKIGANSEVEFQVVKISSSEKLKAEDLCFSRFVPERTDDYTWENDKVAFRVYGPKAQMLKETGQKGGTLSSGVDAWLKRVEYPIINKWYKETLIDKTGSYHKDTGEGLDNFHVGVSRGAGGIAVKDKSSLYYSKNYVKWRTITTGPLRTSFYLEYENWTSGSKSISESKIITLDLGNNLSKFETNMSGTEEIYAGLTLHEKDGVVSSGNGWVTYWQPHADSELGTAIVADSKTFVGSEKHDVEEKDLSNAYAELKVSNNQVTYYAGFAWKKSKQYPTKESWTAYLDRFSKEINTPLLVSLK